MDVEGDKGRTYKSRDQFIHALAKFLDMPVRKHVLMLRRGILLQVILAAADVIHV